jgi:anaerobic selenocysteine-containing dehydrogenase
MFVELSVELAKLRGIKNGDRVTISSPRGKMWAKAMVTSRLKPFNVAGQTVHLVGMTWHYGWLVPKDGGDSSNILTPSIGDANTMIPEYKVFLVNVTKEEKPKVEKKPEAKAEAKPEPKAEKKPEPKPEAKPGPKAETKK